MIPIGIPYTYLQPVYNIVTIKSAQNIIYFTSFGFKGYLLYIGIVMVV